MEYAPSMVIQKAKGGISENSVRAGFQELEKMDTLLKEKKTIMIFMKLH